MDVHRCDHGEKDNIGQAEEVDLTADHLHKFDAQEKGAQNGR